MRRAAIRAIAMNGRGSSCGGGASISTALRAAVDDPEIAAERRIAGERQDRRARPSRARRGKRARAAGGIMSVAIAPSHAAGTVAVKTRAAVRREHRGAARAHRASSPRAAVRAIRSAAAPSASALVEPEFLELVGIVDPVEIDMQHRQRDFGRRIGLDDREARARRLARQPERARAAPRASSSCPRRARPTARSRRPARSSAASRAPNASARGGIRRAGIGVIASRGRLDRDQRPLRPAPTPARSSPPCASTNCLASGRPSPSARSPLRVMPGSAKRSNASATASASCPGRCPTRRSAPPSALPSAWSRMRPPSRRAADRVAQQMLDHLAQAAAHRPSRCPVDGAISTAKSSFLRSRQRPRPHRPPSRATASRSTSALFDRRRPPVMLGQVEHIVDQRARAARPIRGSPRHSRPPPRSACRHSPRCSISAKPLIEVSGVRSS